MEIKGLNKDNIIKISEHKKEADWVKNYRLKSYEYFEKMNKDLPFGPKFKLNFDGEACAISTSATSIFLRKIIGKSVDEVKDLI